MLSKLKLYNASTKVVSSKSINIVLLNSELQVLFALCDSCHHFKNEAYADVLYPLMNKYLLTAANCAFKSLSLFKLDDLTPWTKLTNKITKALIDLSINFPKFKDLLCVNFADYLSLLDTSCLYHQFSIVGFIQAITAEPIIITENVYDLLMSSLNENFFDRIEETLSLVSKQEDIDYIYVFQDLGLEYSSLYFIDLVQKLHIEYLKFIVHATKQESLLDHLLATESISYAILDKNSNMLNRILQFQYKIEDYISNSSDRIVNSTLYRRKTSLATRAYALEIYSLNNKISNLPFNFVNAKVSTYLSEFMVSIEDGSTTALEMISSNILLNVFGTAAIISEDNQLSGLNIAKHFPIIVQTIVMPKEFVKKLAIAVKYCLKSLSKDDMISLIYTLINMIEPDVNFNTQNMKSHKMNASINESMMVERNDLVAQNFITSVIEISKSSDDESIMTLVTTLLYQKISSHPNELNAILLDGLTELVDSMNKKDFASLLKYYYDVSEASLRDRTSYNLNIETWNKFSQAMSKSANDELYNVYLNGLLFQIVSKGDIDDLEHHRSNQVVTESAREIMLFLKPLANLLPDISESPRIPTDKETIRRFQDAWFNLTIHGFAYNSPLYHECLPQLLRIAHSTPPLASEATWNRSETSIEMNTILRRGTSKTSEKLHKEVLRNIISLKSGSIDPSSDNQLSRPGLMFLSSTLMVEMLRVQTGDSSKVLETMSDPSVVIAKLHTHVAAIASYCTTHYATSIVNEKSFITMEKITTRLKEVLIACCHRNADLQHCAFRCADIIISKIPSVLCYKSSLFALLDILALLFQSLIDADTNEYEPMTVFKSRVTDINLQLSDSYKWRQNTLDQFTNNATKWVLSALRLCDGDMKAVLRAYVIKADASHRTINYGVSFALDMASRILSNDREFFQLQGSQGKKLNSSAGFLSQTPWKSDKKLLDIGFADVDGLLMKLDDKISRFSDKVIKSRGSHKVITHHEFSDLMEDLSRVIFALPERSAIYIKHVVDLPFLLFDSYTMEHAISDWLNIMHSQPKHASLILSYILENFEKTVIEGKGLYSRAHDISAPQFNPMEYLPTNKVVVNHNSKISSSALKSHLLLIRFLSAHFQATLFQNDTILRMFTHTALIAIDGLKAASLHPFARMIRFELINFGCDLLRHHILINSPLKDTMIHVLLDGALSWFTQSVSVPFGSNKLKFKADYEILNLVALYLSTVQFKNIEFEKRKVILLLFIDDELNILFSWIHPLRNTPENANAYCRYKFDEKVLKDAYAIDGRLAVNLVQRYEKNGEISNSITKQLRQLIINDPFKVVTIPSAVKYISDADVPAIVAWASAAPVDAINKFLPPHNRNALMIQYAMRSIESFDVHLTFFYVPQIVQTMRHDDLGYIRRFILETASVSQLFAHQIIWNMAANSFKDEESTIPDSIKPLLDEIRETMITSFSDYDRAYFEKEFSFFGEVTGISGKLKPFIKKSKPEKKAKIDEEMAKIKVEEGVYLPSNPDGTVVDIDRKSGKPLQSHAKAPFMATFLIKRKREILEIDESADLNKLDNVEEDIAEPEQDETNDDTSYEIVKTSAIFKVGDDCRQDVLALQLISMFRTIWMTSGVDVYVFPYRVTATAPGCGIIDVLPRSISRDMLGREAVNGLYEYFISQFGPETSPEFQRARINFVKSLAAYSIITYLLAIKDRHNGNIMYDQDGHILHIDFGFCFDIVPGGVKFEQSPFKLTREMVRVMGGSVNTQAYKWFEELCVKCFLACRLHMDSLIGMVTPMLESGLPCFKPATMKHLTQRFVPHKSDKEAAIYIKGLVKKSFESFATKGYDEFQRLTNGIPY